MSGARAITVDGHISPLMFRIVISADGGDNWNLSIPVNIPADLDLQDVAATQNRILVLTMDDSGALGVVSGDLNGQNWSPFVPLPNSTPGSTNAPFILGDTTSEVAMVRQTIGGTSWDHADLYVYRTTDGGQTWDAGRNLSAGHMINLFSCVPELFCHEKLWGLVWEDYWNPDTTQWGVYCRISANHGKDWYPAQPLGLDVESMRYSGGQFLSNEIRVYWSDWEDYATATGTLTPDTSAPTITLDLIAPDTIHAGDALVFHATVEDNGYAL
jgi:hypothetical protein